MRKYARYYYCENLSPPLGASRFSSRLRNLRWVCARVVPSFVHSSRGGTNFCALQITNSVHAMSVHARFADFSTSNELVCIGLDVAPDFRKQDYSIDYIHFLRNFTHRLIVN